MNKYNEDNLVQKTTADYLHNNLGWDTFFAYNNETLGRGTKLGRKNEKEVVLIKYLYESLKKLNPNKNEEIYNKAIEKILENSVSQGILYNNLEKHNLIKNGVKVTFKNNEGNHVTENLKIIDFNKIENNNFLAVRELWIKGPIYRRRADLVCFVNGLPLLFIECKNINKNIRRAYEENLSDYKDTIPHLFNFNSIILLANGYEAKIGTITSSFEHFHLWNRLDEDEVGSVDMETLLKGICNKKNFIDILENFIIFDKSLGEPIKILAKNHQYIGVNKTIKAFKNREKAKGKLGVFWHTQGSGKSYSMAFFTNKIHRKIGSNFTFVICTDREDLDTQIYNTYAGLDIVYDEPSECRASSGEHLKELLSSNKPYVFTLVQKFNKEIEDDKFYSSRKDIIIITDEAHRTQYGILALNMRKALPNASYLGFTGTPLFKDDEITAKVFGDYVSVYDFDRAVKDKSTVPLYYDSRGEKLGINVEDLDKKIADKIEELEIANVDIQQNLENNLNRNYHIITATKRLQQISKDFVEHYSKSWGTGKAMMVCIDKITCVNMYNYFQTDWKNKITELKLFLKKSNDEQQKIDLVKRINWMEETIIGVVVSEEQGEVKKFEEQGLDIQFHRKIMKSGFTTKDNKRIDIETAFKKSKHPFRVAIVCSMWLTGFDVPSLANLYLDKPLKAHTLMQAIARANRVSEGKNNGLIIDYIGILNNLRNALAVFATQRGDDKPHPNPIESGDTKLIDELNKSINQIKVYLSEKNLSLDNIIKSSGFNKNREIINIKEKINENLESRKKYQIMSREVFKKFKSCLSLDESKKYRADYEVIRIIYRSLKEDTEKANIAHILKELQIIIDSSININNQEEKKDRIYDISKIDFDKLKSEFEKNKTKNTIVQKLNSDIDKRLNKLMSKNPSRINFQNRYEDIINEYNREKDRVTIEKTFEDLLYFVKDLEKEEKRALREDMSEESLAIFDLLTKENCTKSEVKQIKTICKKLFQEVKDKIYKLKNWKDSESMRDEIKTTIFDELYRDDTGLPSSYSSNEIKLKSEEIYQYIYETKNEFRLEI